MLRKGLFRKPRNKLEEYGSHDSVANPSVPDQLYVKCNGCQRMLLNDEIIENDSVCEQCGYHFRMHARRRIALLCDAGSFEEMDKRLCVQNPIGFPGYEEKLNKSRKASGERESVVTGTARIQDIPCAIFVMDPFFMMGSMGSVVGEKITRLFEYATEHRLPVVGCTASGGARMQEGIFSLMQMAKTSAAVGRHSQAGLLYVAVLTDPTTGGVTASFAMLADIILAEPGALIAFAGPKVIEQTMKQKLPSGFQRTEFLIDHGFVDAAVPRKTQKQTLAYLLSLHQNGKVAEAGGNDFE